MRLTRTLQVGGWVFISLNLMMAFGAIAVFVRMTPAIEGIIQRNARSLEAGEQMVASLALALADRGETDSQLDRFAAALERARRNVTEPGEPAALATIAADYRDAFTGRPEAVRRTVMAVAELCEINRDAMWTADEHARQLGQAGAWGIVFMSAAIFLTAVLSVRLIRRRVVQPLEEIHAVLTAYQGGNLFRRCSGIGLHQDVRTIYGGVNEVLDHVTRAQAGARFGKP